MTSEPTKNSKVPTFELKQIKFLISEDRFDMTQRALKDADEIFGLSERDLLDHIIGLTETNFRYTDVTKSSPKHQGVQFDVYQKQIADGGDAFIKVTVNEDRLRPLLVVISFHEYT